MRCSVTVCPHVLEDSPSANFACIEIEGCVSVVTYDLLSGCCVPGYQGTEIVFW
jgi:hypothetical protein